ncbi:MAG: pentapeptide repeat-containing protein, partial [Anaerolineae bacterium]|nr:pentapeptide repeat-containing protein [Anaerolineae bacterium]
MDLLSALAAGKRLFRRQTLEDADLREADLTEVVIKNSTFANCDFHMANMVGCRLEDCTFTNCRFSDADLSEGQFTRCIFYAPDKPCAFVRADLRHSKWEECDVRLCTFEKAQFLKVNWQQVNATGA